MQDPYERAVAKAIGSEVAMWRARRGYSQDDLAGPLQCAKRTVKSYERGERRFSIADIMRLGQFFRIQPEVLLVNVPSPPKVIPLSVSSSAVPDKSSGAR